MNLSELAQRAQRSNHNGGGGYGEGNAVAAAQPPVIASAGVHSEHRLRMTPVQIGAQPNHVLHYAAKALDRFPDFKVEYCGERGLQSWMASISAIYGSEVIWKDAVYFGPDPHAAILGLIDLLWMGKVPDDPKGRGSVDVPVFVGFRENADNWIARWDTSAGDWRCSVKEDIDLSDEFWRQCVQPWKQPGFVPEWDECEKLTPQANRVQIVNLPNPSGSRVQLPNGQWAVVE